MLKEARIVMPTSTLADSAPAHAALLDAIIAAFGGATIYSAEGAWHDVGNRDVKVVWDDVKIYDVAIDDTTAGRLKLLDIALDAGRALAQTAVYVRYPDGRVDIVDTKLGQGEEASIILSDAKIAEVRDAYMYKLGAKRLPQVGEVWRNRNGALVAVMSAASILDGGYNVVTISKSESARSPGHVYTVNLDGHIHRQQQPSDKAGGDLISFVTRFDS